jgi:acetyl-CoA carboxylase biotin carboxylase subunit
MEIPMAKPITKVLIANRGEIARRVARTCRRLGIATVAVYSDADEAWPFVREADEAFRLGAGPSAESYLSIERLMEAARVTGADALHPGYGFLSENAALARACAEAGVVFIGPTADAIDAMGSKQRAKKLMAEAGVPVIPGYGGESQDTETLAARGRELGFPLLIKASAGGGGKGMKRVDRDEELLDAIGAARREAKSSFGDDTVLIERYVTAPRHVEIQILGDSFGNVIHLGERECSIQRRHQKVVEEAPSPMMDEPLRAAMGEAALRAARTIGYQSAGTVEFVVDADRNFYFLEVNTRLQVEHPVTELVTGLDLVEQQIRVAEGRPLDIVQDDVCLSGSAIEVRLYAEDPDRGFLPETGTLVDFSLPPLEGVRLDTGVESGTEVSIHYDPMLAKVIAHGPDRTTATRRLVRALEVLSVHGVRTNRAYLLAILRHEAFASAALDTHFLERHLAGVVTDAPSEAAITRAAVLAALHGVEQRRGAGGVLPRGLPVAFRNTPASPERLELGLGERTVVVSYRFDRRAGIFSVDVDGVTQPARIVASSERELSVTLGDHRIRGRVVADGQRIHVTTGGASLSFVERPRFPEPERATVKGGATSPMPGKVVAVEVAVGDTVTTGQVLVRLEAMKMEHVVCADVDGIVREVRAEVGDQVGADALLAVVEPSA